MRAATVICAAGALVMGIVFFVHSARSQNDLDTSQQAPSNAVSNGWLAPAEAQQQKMRHNADEASKDFPDMLPPLPPNPHSLAWYDVHPRDRSKMLTQCFGEDRPNRPAVCQDLMNEEAARIEPHGETAMSWMEADPAYLRAKPQVRTTIAAACRNAILAHDPVQCAAAQAATHAYPP
jgi:hypothetical protein